MRFGTSRRSRSVPKKTGTTSQSVDAALTAGLSGLAVGIGGEAVGAGGGVAFGDADRDMGPRSDPSLLALSATSGASLALSSVAGLRSCSWLRGSGAVPKPPPGFSGLDGGAGEGGGGGAADGGGASPFFTAYDL